MAKNLITATILTVFCFAMLFITGCETEAQNSALLGTAIGAGIGALAGGDTEGALIGGAVGGGVGYVAGNEADKKKNREQMEQIRTEQNQIPVWITNTNGSKQKVVIKRSGPNFIGPRGEVYDTMPTEEQLRTAYGF